MDYKFYKFNSDTINYNGRISLQKKIVTTGEILLLKKYCCGIATEELLLRGCYLGVATVGFLLPEQILTEEKNAKGKNSLLKRIHARDKS